MNSHKATVEQLVTPLQLASGDIFIDLPPEVCVSGVVITASDNVDFVIEATIVDRANNDIGSTYTADSSKTGGYVTSDNAGGGGSGSYITKLASVTTDAVPRFAADGEVKDTSVVIDDNNNVRVNASSNVIDMNNTGSTDVPFRLLQGGTVKATCGWDNNDTAFKVNCADASLNSNNHLVVKDTGVGIGRLPTYALDVLGDLRVTANGDRLIAKDAGVGIGRVPEWPLDVMGRFRVTSNGDKLTLVEDDVTESEAHIKLKNGTSYTNIFLPVWYMKGNYKGAAPATGMACDSVDDTSARGAVFAFTCMVQGGSVASRDVFGVYNHNDKVFRIRGNGDFVFTGQVRMGDINAPAIKQKKFTGNTADTDGGYISVAHGISNGADHIVSIAGYIKHDTGKSVMINTTVPNRSNYAEVDGDNIVLHNVSGDCAEILDKGYEIVVTYTA